VDSETSTWQPTGLAKELKANVCRKYLGLWNERNQRLIAPNKYVSTNLNP
jgi:hypothetical protein